MQTKYNLEAIFTWIVAYKMNHDGNSPSLRQISEEFEIRSPGHAHRLLRELEKQGRIQLGEGQYRAITVTGGRWQWNGRRA